MIKRISLLLVLLLFCSDFIWAQRARVAQEDDRAARKQWEADLRADEFANSLRRRDWLKDRLILQLGMGTKFPVMGANWFGFGAGVEYITRWHFSGFITGGFIPAHDDPVFNPELYPEEGGYSLDGGLGWRVGMAYYMFPKSPIHLGIQASYGTVFYDHEAEPDPSGVRSIIICRGYELDLVVSYLSDEWYFLQAMIGFYTIGNGAKDGGNSWGRTNNSWNCGFDEQYMEYRCNSLVETNQNNANDAIPPVGVVFGIGIGFAFEEFFPDDTELRRREREDRKKNQSPFRASNTPSSSRRPTNNR